MNCPDFLLKNGIGDVPLFSAISLKGTPLARSWAELLPEARKEFPTLRWEGPRELHITLIYLGTGWAPQALEEMSQIALVGPNAPVDGWEAPVHPEVFGRNGQVVVLRLDNVPDEWSQRITEAKTRLNALGYKKPDDFDTSFKPHITLARSTKPTEEAEVIQRFQKWITDASQKHPAFRSVKITSEQKPQFLLSYRTEPKGPKYTPLLQLCAPAVDCSNMFRF